MNSSNTYRADPIPINIPIIRELARSWVGAGLGLPKIESILREPMELVVPTNRF
jgi:hypothetical protein